MVILYSMPTNYLYCQNNILKDLELLAADLRKNVIEMLATAQSGHPAGALGTAEIFTALYFHVLNINPQSPKDKTRDRFVLSNGHICPILYAALAHRGFFPKEDLKKLRQLGSPLQGHPHNLALPGIETSSGPLGHGLSQAIGMALAARLDNLDYRTYCMISDGELNEGQTWEALLFAGSNKINNLTLLVDRNGIQLSGNTENVLPLESLREKLEAFNWYVLEIDGHNVEEIVNACQMAKTITQRPTAIIAHTIPGKGVKFMEYKFEWHGKPPTSKEAEFAAKELEQTKSQIGKKYE